MKRWDIAAVMACDAIYMLEGWERSEGAQVEHAIASWMRKDIFYEARAEVPA